MIRQQAQLTISRFVELIDVPRRTYHYRLAKAAGEAHQGGTSLSRFVAGVWGRLSARFEVLSERLSDDLGDRDSFVFGPAGKTLLEWRSKFRRRRS